MITAGIDCGAKYTKTIVLKDGKILGKGKVLTGFDPAKAVEVSLSRAVQAAGIARADIQRIGGTGSGKESVKMADVEADDIKAMSKGAHFFFPTARTVSDVGAEEGRAARIDETGNPVDFVINEKCAAGAGAFIEAMAESEVVGLIHAKTDKSDISKAIHDSIASRIVSMIRRIGVNKDIAMLGGVGNNPGVMTAMRRELQIESILVPDEPEYGAAVGAAVVAAEAAGL
jgi:benzoyl-CoA reductase subunit D